MNLVIGVVKATYLSDYKVLVNFSDSTQQVLDFENFLNQNSHPQYSKYRNRSNFKKFKIEAGNLVWGKDWDLIFPVEQLHSGKIKI